jgi:hypothetical protein
MRALLAVAALGATIALLPVPGHAQSNLTAIERSQRLTLEGNRNVLGNQNQERYQQQLDLEKQVYDESRRRREDYRFQGNTQQRALETQLRAEDLRIRDQDRRNREYEEKQRQEEARALDDSRRRAGIQ